MTREETQAVLALLRVAYPNFYKDLKKAEADEIINLWAAMFADDEPQIVTEAVKAMISTLRYPPTIADVKEKIRLITSPETMTEIEAWNLVYDAIQTSNYNAKENFNRLPLIIQKLVGSPNQLKEWAVMDADTVKSVIQSNFMRSYTARAKAEAQREMLPGSTKKLMLELSEKFKMIEEPKDEKHCERKVETEPVQQLSRLQQTRERVFPGRRLLQELSGLQENE